MKYLVKNKHWEIDKEYNCDKLLYLLIDRPNKILNDEYFIWENNKGQQHRDYDLPAISAKDGTVVWYKNGNGHRNNNKPIAIQSDGYKEYYKNNVQHHF